MKQLSKSDFIEGIRQGNRRILAKAITLVESSRPADRELAEELIKELLPYCGNSIRVGITGVPGAGKSTFVEIFGLKALEAGHKVAVLAVDPSSIRNGGSILGDKTRMEELSKSENAFIRPSPNSGFLGGIANATYESMLLCEAAGYDFILIETVGVGQSEVMVSEISDMLVMIKILGEGDELQGIKRGIMEMIDLIFINKVDDSNKEAAKKARLELLRALYFMPQKEKDWKTPVLLGSALDHVGVDEVYEAILAFIAIKKENGTFFEDREGQAEKRFKYWVEQYIVSRTQSDPVLKSKYKEHLENSAHLKSSPMAEARAFVNALLGR